MPQDWGASGIQSMNSKVADCCFFSLFTCFFPRTKQLQPPMGWCSGSGGCSQPREQNSSCVALTPALTPQIPSQPQPAAPGALCSPASTATPRAGLQEGWTQAVVVSGCNSRVRAETALQGPLCLTSVPTEASRAFGPLLGGSSCGGSRNRRLWKPPVPCTL